MPELRVARSIVVAWHQAQEGFTLLLQFCKFHQLRHQRFLRVEEVWQSCFVHLQMQLDNLANYEGQRAFSNLPIFKLNKSTFQLLLIYLKIYHFLMGDALELSILKMRL